MALAAKQHAMNRAEFLDWETTQTEKHDYWQGEIST